MPDAQKLVTYLRYRIGDEAEGVVLWDTVEVTVGRAPTQDLVVPDRDVSRQHAVFRCKGGRHSVEDCGTTLGTRVNGEPVRTADLEAGDVIEIGRLRVEFQQTREPLRRGGAVRFASELKGGALGPPEGDPGDRTVLGFDPDQALASTPRPSEAPAPSGPRALSSAGALEDVPEIGSDHGPALEDLEAWTERAAAPRDLDLELAAESVADDAEEDPNALTRPSLSTQSAPPPAPAPALGAHASLELRVVVSGPLPRLQALLAALGEEEIRAGGLRFEVRPARGR